LITCVLLVTLREYNELQRFHITKEQRAVRRSLESAAAQLMHPALSLHV
jgi:hypothetical protein